MKSYLTTSAKDRLKPYLLKRDGSDCLFCGKPLEPNPETKAMRITIEHLDGIKTHNDKENLALAHWHCNNLKKTWPEYQVIAANKLQENKLTFDSLDECELTPPAPKEASKEIDLNVAMKRQTWEYLNDRLITKGKEAINLSDTIHSISFIFWQKTGHGSSETIKRYVKDFCSSAAPFKIESVNGEELILKRQ